MFSLPSNLNVNWILKSSLVRNPPYVHLLTEFEPPQWFEPVFLRFGSTLSYRFQLSVRIPSVPVVFCLTVPIDDERGLLIRKDEDHHRVVKVNSLDERGGTNSQGISFLTRVLDSVRSVHGRGSLNLEVDSHVPPISRTVVAERFWEVVKNMELRVLSGPRQKKTQHK